MRYLFLLFILSTTFSTSAQDKYVVKGKEKMSSGEYNDAIKLFSKSIDKSASTEAYNERAMAYWHINEKTKALDDLSTSLEMDEKQPAIWISRGKLYLKTSKYKKAVEDFSTVLKTDSKNTEALTERGEAYSKLHELSLACEDWANAASLGEKRAQALLQIRCSENEVMSTEYMQNKIRK